MFNNNMIQRNPVGVSLDCKVLDALDRKRGLVNRSRYIEKLIESDIEE